MAAISFIPGKYELSPAENGAFVLTPLLVNNQESFVPLSQQPSNRQFPIIRKPSIHCYTSTLGLVGGIGFIVSCVWSILLPAIGSVGVVTFAYLIDRKITLLYAKELSSEAAKSQDLFTQKIGNRAGSENLLDSPIDIDSLPPPMLPMPDVTNPITHLTNENNKPNILPPPPPPLPPNSRSLLGKSVNTGNLPSLKPSLLSNDTLGKINPLGTRGKLLEEICRGKNLKLNIENAERKIKKYPEEYPSSLLLKELKATYERALALGKVESLSKTYFKDKVDNFEKNFAILEQKESQTTEEMEGICKKASYLDSLLKNMQWVKSLLDILSGRRDLSEKTRKHCSEKLKSIDRHIEKLQRCNEKKLEEPENTAETPGEILFKAVNEKFSPQQSSNEIKTPEQKLKERNIAVHGDGTSDNSDAEASDDDWCD